MRNLHHPHIVALFDCLETKSQVHLVMEFCELGDLSNFIRKRSSLVDHEMTRDMMLKYPNPPAGGLNEVICRHFLKQISSAIQYLHSKNTLHRDIKPQNLLLVPSAAWYDKHRTGRPLFQDGQTDIPPAGLASLPQLKIADFGFARFLPSLSLAETLCGSPLYMAPEILRYEKYDNKADLWSVGTVLHEMVVGKPPFRAQNHVDLLRKIERSEDKIRFPECNTISAEMKIAIRALLKKSPIDRVSYENFFALEVIVKDIPGLVGDDLPAPKVEPTLEIDVSGDSIAKELASAKNTSPIDPKLEEVANTSRPSSRRLSTTPGKQSLESPPPVQSPPGSPRVRDRRPSLTHHATAPTARTADRRQSLTGDRSYQDQPRSMLKAHLDQKRGVPVEDKALREIREKAAQDVAFERDYVLVEKRSVEVNALADEMGHSPLVQQGSPHQPGALIRRATTAGVPLSTTAPVSTGAAARAMQMLGRRESLHSRNSSYDKNYGRSPVSGAITKALNMANQRLFGIGISPPLPSGPSPPRAYSAFPTYPTAAQSSMLMIGDGGKTIEPRDDDMRVALLLEDLATRSDVVWGFAEVKYQQLLPTRPQSPQPGFGMRSKKKSDETAIEDDEDEGLTVDAIIIIAEEALVLYVKALAILARVIDVAGNWWGQKHRGEIISTSPRSAPVRGAGGPAAVSATKINSIVQWARNRFNDCLEKSEFVGRKLQDAQRQLPSDHPAHPSNHPAGSVGSSAGVGTSAENFQLTTGVTAEGLMYDRALEMSRTAAVQEAMGRELDSSEVSYRTAICMLEAILDNDEDRTGRQSSILRKEMKDDEEGTIDGLETEDRAAIKSRKSCDTHSGDSIIRTSANIAIVLDGLKKRLRVLKRKMEDQKKQFENERNRKKAEEAKSGRRRSMVPASTSKPSPSRLSSGNAPQLALTPPQ